jgi:hypothetical protein
MGYFYFQDGDKEFDQLDVYPGASTKREALMEITTATCVGYSASTWNGLASLTQTSGRPEVFEGPIFNTYGSDGEPGRSIRLAIDGADLSVMVGTSTHTFISADASTVAKLSSTFFSHALGRDHPAAQPSTCP